MSKRIDLLAEGHRGLAPHRAGVWPLVSAEEMRALDRLTIEEREIPGEVLMESAGRALAGPVLGWHARAGRDASPIRILCGAGNNGGDGFVLGRHLHAEGVATETILVGDPARLPPDAASNWRRLAAVGAPHRVLEASTGRADWQALLEDASVIVDALFGTGLARPVEGGLAELIEVVREAHEGGVPVVSVDVPSGICADTGAILGAAIAADETVTISLPKIGLALEPGRTHAGAISVARVGIADPDPARTPRAELWNARAIAGLFPERPSAGHKGSFGHVLVIAGSAGKTGAAALSARAASRAGAGLVTVALPQGVEGEIGGLPVEVMSESAPASEAGCFAATAEKALCEWAAARDVVALGPGLGRDPMLPALVEGLARSIDRPMVIDADGLFALHGRLDALTERRAPTILTPHPGEAAHLLDSRSDRINQDRPAAARELARRADAIVVLKGAATVIANPEGRAVIIPTGGPALASGGTGDVLTGVVAGLLASGIEAFDAALLGAWWHGATADHLIRGRAGFGLMASEVADALPESAAAIVRGLIEGENEGENEEGECNESLALRFPGP